MCRWVSRITLQPNLNHFRAALRAPSAGDGVNEITTRTPYIQCAGECIRLAFPALVCRLIFKHDNEVQGQIPSENDNRSLLAC